MSKDFGKKLDEINGSRIFFARVFLPATLSLILLLRHIHTAGFAGFPLGSKLVLAGCTGGVILLLAVNAYRAVCRRFEIYQRGIIIHENNVKTAVSYSNIDHFEWEDDDIQFMSIRLCCKYCHIVDKQNARVASLNSREYGMMNKKMAKLENKLGLR